MNRTFAIVDQRISRECERTLSILGFSVIKLPPASLLSPPIASHTDMLLFHHGSTLISSTYYCDEAPYVFSDIHDALPSLKLVFADEKFSDAYPHDAIFNALVMGNRIFIKTDTASSALIEYARKAGLEVFHVNQGYPACTTLALTECDAITADHGMANVLKALGISVTEIENGGISLPPYEYGFIGGTAGVFDGRVYFLGDVSTHPDKDKILSAIENAGLTHISLSGEELRDLGGILFLEEHA